MKTCPSCGKEVRAERTVCGCGELLRAEVTQVHAWETETVLGTRQAPAQRRHFTVLIALVIGLTILGVAWIGIRQNLTAASSENKHEPPTSPSQTLTADDTRSHADDLRSSSLSSQEGVFILSQNARSTAMPAKASRVQAERSGAISPTAAETDSPSTESLESNLLESAPAPPSSTDGENSPADCKPDSSLKRPEQSTPAKVQRSSTSSDNGQPSRTYILGPRGGCFFVTPGGGKKYVDRGLCPQSATTGARQ
ncbi:MAG TPA: hypothetical protein VGJ02_11955 [Pyrinomonadaceae bacterium]|jgi:hypothetical protein